MTVYSFVALSTNDGAYEIFLDNIDENNYLKYDHFMAQIQPSK